MLEDSRFALRHLSHGRRFFRCGLPRYCSATPHSETALNLSGYGYILPLTTLSLLPEGLLPQRPEDAEGGPHDVIWGTGVLDVPAMLSILKEQGFKGYFAIEYEYNWDNSVPDIRKSIEYFNDILSL